MSCHNLHVISNTYSIDKLLLYCDLIQRLLLLYIVFCCWYIIIMFVNGLEGTIIICEPLLSVGTVNWGPHMNGLGGNIITGDMMEWLLRERRLLRRFRGDGDSVLVDDGDVDVDDGDERTLSLCLCLRLCLCLWRVLGGVCVDVDALICSRARTAFTFLFSSTTEAAFDLTVLCSCCCSATASCIGKPGCTAIHLKRQQYIPRAIHTLQYIKTVRNTYP